MKRILIVNCFFDPQRVPVKRKFKIPQPMTPAYLAGIFSAQNCDIRLYDEVYSGPLLDPKLLAFPDMLVLTGLNIAFDRMLHITAHVKTKNPKAVVVAGGAAIRALYHYAQNFFEYCCRGDIEQLGEVVEEVLGREYLAETFVERGWVIPRYDLAYWMKLISYVETSRNCYFKCNYCSLTGEGAGYRVYDLDYVRLQIMKLGRKSLIHFIDNNFATNNKRFAAQRFDMLADLHARGYIKQWGAEVTCDFFFDDENLERSLESGCGGLFCGLESFNNQALNKFRKPQNVIMPQIELIQKCLRADIPFHYGIVFDLAARTVEDLEREFDFILDTPEIPLPSFITLAIPLLKTPFFYECLDKEMFLPNLRLRDLDGSTITLKPRSAISDAVQFLTRIKSLSGYKTKILQHILRFHRLYRNVLSLEKLALAQYGAFLLSAPRLSTLQMNAGNGHWPSRRSLQRAFVGSSDPLDLVYQPLFHIDARYRHYFEPTPFTDDSGYISEALQADLCCPA